MGFEEIPDLDNYSVINLVTNETGIKAVKCLFCQCQINSIENSIWAGGFQPFVYRRRWI